MNYKEALHHPIFETISHTAKELGLEAYVIGGFVRDFILNRGDAKDIDIVAIGDGILLAKKVAKNLPSKPRSKFLKPMVPPCLNLMTLKLSLLVPERNLTTKAAETPR